MSDEPIRLETEAAPTPSGIWEHYCEHPGCDSWGGFGFSVAGRAPRWYCAGHMDEGERLLGRTA